ncbi:Subtilisin-like protease SBT1.6 [Bienertia sinuspersici]
MANLKHFFLPSLLFLFTIISAQQPEPEPKPRKTYLIRVDRNSKPSIFPTHYHWYTSEFTTSESEILHTYETVFHGFSAVLTTSHADTLNNHSSILAVIEDRRRYLHTTRSPQFLGLRIQRGLWSESDYGSDVIIGVLDTGIWPERRSFSDQNLGPVPKRWKGICQLGEKFGPHNCNRKIIGARFFNKGHEAAFPEYKSARDADGHGTHTASTAGGRYSFRANMSGYASGVAKGVAPKARLAVYKVCWKNSGCFDSDILAAFDSAVNDGVDVISISIGGGDGISSPYYLDPIAIGSYGAVSRGVFVSSSAGNDGPNTMSVTNLAPWITTVGAGTLDRNFPAEIVLGNGKILKPDLIAPGVNILAGWTDAVGPTGLDVDTRRTEFNILSGTSMACPHVSGAAALLKSAYPDWSPAMIKSAIMTTASVTNNKRKPSTPYDFGSGHLNLDQALDPGLVYDITNDDYVNFLCAIGYGPKTIQVITRTPANCAKKTKASPENLNYPSIAVLIPSSNSKVSSKTFIRTVTNVGEVNSVYKLKVEVPVKGVNVAVKPSTLVFNEKVKRMTYTVTVTADSKHLNLGDTGAGFGSISWDDGKHVVRSPIVVTQVNPL